MLTSMAVTFLALPAPEADPTVGPFRHKHDPSSRRGLGAHITLLYPFLPINSRELDAVAASVPRFHYTLDRIERFPSTIFLGPTPLEPFQRLFEILVKAFPDFAQGHPQHPRFVPHTSVARFVRGNRALAIVQELEIALQESGPIQCHARELVVLRRDEGPWEVTRRCALGASSERV